MLTEHKTRAVTLCIIAAALLTAFLSPALAAQYKCTRVVDGDTIHVIADGADTTIRLVGIDAPETSKSKRDPGQPFSQAATKHLAALVLNKAVSFKTYGADRYGRTLGVVFVDGKDVNLEMLKAGLAEAYRGTPARGFDTAPYLKAENEARRALCGMWSLKDKYVSPREWRAKQRSPKS